MANPKAAYGARAALGMRLAAVTGAPIALEFLGYQAPLSAYTSGKITAAAVSQELALAADENPMALAVISKYLRNPANIPNFSEPALAALAYVPMTFKLRHCFPI